jgi:DEAD/DEAH box helicase domain-containing protein
MQMHTQSFWVSLPEAWMSRFEYSRGTVVEALRSAGVALETVSTLALMCEPSDINRTLGDGYGDAVTDPESALPGRNASQGRTGKDQPTLFLFDAQPGGVGLSKRIFEMAPVLFERAANLIATCPCRAGCPGCMGPTDVAASAPNPSKNDAGTSEEPRSERVPKQRFSRRKELSIAVLRALSEPTGFA